MDNNYINIGKIVSVHALNGEVIIKHALGKKTIFKEGDVIFVEQVKGAYLPHFVTSSKAKTEEETILQFDDIDSREKALKFIKKQVWLTEEDFAKYAAKNSPIALIGFTLLNEGEKLGIIDEVIEQPHQVLLTIKINGKEALIPLHEETLDNIDRKKKEVHVTLPDGLLEIYLE
ncbi:16S rRNA processing protein RimM [Panacibacter ginsenosidivorans]|uniref:Ribosome maturation factor RimM n=1 Tax=Panacibacter ginsenosidivorans TaxID=1813871 RepID=A0A5B8VFA9_9BACT|nr:ribosome maturation factor RimM [Panacibacter ginsenosidivorans]QEC69028.1 16S rRNA processing protein RimM [Panacibacter ginsenosidivorans]